MNHWRADFPIFNTPLDGHPLIYLDSAATAQKPQAVLDALNTFYTQEYASVGRGIYPLAERATQRYEDARAKVAHFIKAKPHEIVFTSGTTHGMNTIAHAWGEHHLQRGDVILMPAWEHHSTMLPWQHVALLKGAVVKYIPVLPDGTLDMNAYDALLSSRVKAVICSHVSNVFGTTVPVNALIEKAHSVGACFILDAAQSAPHGMVNLEKIPADFIVFSGHKMGGPTGIGVLYINEKLHDDMPVYQRGGGMVYEAHFDRARWRKAPYKFEAGTPPFAQAIGLAAAIDYLQTKVNFEQLRAFEASLCARLIQGLSLMPRAKIYGPVDSLAQEGHLVSFTLEGIHVHDAAAFLGSQGICVRAGNLCAQPLAEQLGIQGLIRASMYLYNTEEDIDALLAGLHEVVKVF